MPFKLSARRQEPEATKHRPIDSRRSDQTTAEQALVRIEGEGRGVPRHPGMSPEVGEYAGLTGLGRPACASPSDGRSPAPGIDGRLRIVSLADDNEAVPRDGGGRDEEPEAVDLVVERRAMDRANEPVPFRPVRAPKGDRRRIGDHVTAGAVVAGGLRSHRNGVEAIGPVHQVHPLMGDEEVQAVESVGLFEGPTVVWP